MTKPDTPELILVGFGSPTIDVHLLNGHLYEEPYEPGGKTEVLPPNVDPEHIEFIALGGNVVNVLNGEPANDVFSVRAIATAIGTGPRGQEISSWLEYSGIDTTHVINSPGHKDGLSIIQYDPERGDRHALCAPRDNTDCYFDIARIREVTGSATHVVLTSSKSPELNGKIAGATPEEISLSFNPSIKEINTPDNRERTLYMMRNRKAKRVGAMLLLIVNETEAAALAEEPVPDNLKDAGRIAGHLNKYADHVAVTLGAKGLVLAVDGDSVPYGVIPESHHDRPFTLGAGDAAHCATLTGIAVGLDPDGIVEMANHHADLVLGHKHARSKPPENPGSGQITNLITDTWQ